MAEIYDVQHISRLEIITKQNMMYLFVILLLLLLIVIIIVIFVNRLNRQG